MFEIGEEVYWVGWNCGEWYVYGLDKIISINESGVYELEVKTCLYTTTLPFSSVVCMDYEEAEKKCKELNEKRYLY